MRATRPTTFTMDRVAFERACGQLAELVEDFAPDAVVGIATGGAYVAEEMVRSMPGSPILTDVRVSRSSTKLKQRLSAGAVLKRLPEWLTDRLRWLEVAMRERFVGTRPKSQEVVDATLHAHPELAEQLAGAQRLIIVDDTIDSGQTLILARSVIEQVAPGAEIQTAVLTSTWKRPPVRPTYCLHERTLVRFFWSFDADRAAVDGVESVDGVRRKALA